MRLSAARDVTRLRIFKSEREVGSLLRTEQGAKFEYFASYLSDEKAEQVAFTLPLQEAPHEIVGDNLHPFFSGLLPEGRRLTALTSAVKTSDDDLFSLLAASGTDTIGDVFAVPPNIPVAASQPITLDELENISLQEVFERSITADDYRARIFDSSIAGVQPKLSEQMISFPAELNKKNKRLIIKLAPSAYPQLVENEYFFMRMAENCNLQVAATQVVEDRDGRSALLVERFDRVYSKPEKRFKRLHQEDACQFLGRYPHDKYRLSMRSIAEGIQQFATSPQVELLRLLELYAFCYLTGNGDLHAKNISLLKGESGRVSLSPVYDLVCTYAYGDEEMALHLEGKKKNIRKKEFFAFAEREGIRRAAVESMLKRLLSSVEPHLVEIQQVGFEDKLTKKLESELKRRYDHLR